MPRLITPSTSCLEPWLDGWVEQRDLLIIWAKEKGVGDGWRWRWLEWSSEQRERWRGRCRDGEVERERRL